MIHRRRLASLCFAALLLSSLLPVSAQGNASPTVQITTHWVDGTGAENPHAYLLTFSDNGTYGIDVELLHERNGVALPNTHTVSWDSTDGFRTALLNFNTSLAWGDSVDLTVSITEHNGVSGLEVEASRNFVVGLWNQPMDDHEVLLSTSWALEQDYATEEGNQNFSLAFTGQGWQQRIGETLSSWELGNGTFQTVESTENGTTDLDLVLTQLWKNETVVAGVLTSQIFDARGHGGLRTTVVDGETVTVIDADVSEASLNRSVINGVVGEHLSLEATGSLNISEESGDDSSLNIDGELAVFFFEYTDVDGVRVLQHTQFEAMADFVLIDEDTRLDVSLDGFTSINRWEEGVRTQHLEELYGQGTFGFVGEDDNASVQVNGTILDLHTKLENGTTLIDDLHVDGTITGDVQGDFGVVRGIETTGMQRNATGDEFLVNVIFQESWFNITGISGGNFFDGAGVGATHNQTWDYQAVQSDWDNRTVRLVWRQTGPDASEGEEYPERSPQQRNASVPDTQEGLGNLTVGRENGLMPIPLIKDDRIRLAQQEGIVLNVVAGDTRVDTRDGHNLTVIEWSGTYGSDGETGTATGTMVSVGPLKGLLSSVQRTLAVPFGEDDESVSLAETQTLARVLSPAIVSEDENTAPTIGEVQWRDGLAFGEGGAIAHLEIHVADDEWNIVAVEADLASLGLGLLALNDRGLDGDLVVGDDVFTASVVISGLHAGPATIGVTATDSFGASSSLDATLHVDNLPPRLLEVEAVPGALERGQSIVINVRAYDGHGVAAVHLDLREYGGDVVELTTEDGSLWAGMVTMPNGMTPGEQSLLVVAEDGLGASTQQRYFTPTSVVGDSYFGPHHVNSAAAVDITVRILNDRPTIILEQATVSKKPASTHVYTVQVTDPDGIQRVQIRLGIYAPIGGPTWTNMHDDGVNGGDEVANDGVYTAVLSVREGTPLGTHEIAVRAFDAYGEMNTGDAVVKLVADDSTATVSGGVDSQVLIGLGVILFFGAVVVLVQLWRRNEEGGNDRFGMQ